LNWFKLVLTGFYRDEVGRSVRVVAEEAAPQLKWPVVLEDVEESVRTKLVKEIILRLKKSTVFVYCKNAKYRK
jgi:hypothetical protein